MQFTTRQIFMKIWRTFSWRIHIWCDRLQVLVSFLLIFRTVIPIYVQYIKPIEEINKLSEQLNMKLTCFTWKIWFYLGNMFTSERSEWSSYQQSHMGHVVDIQTARKPWNKVSATRKPAWQLTSFFPVWLCIASR